MHFIKKNIIIPLVVFIIGMSDVAVVVCGIMIKTVVKYAVMEE